LYGGLISAKVRRQLRLLAELAKMTGSFYAAGAGVVSVSTGAGEMRLW
jgi:hypothetical protein